MSEYKRPGAWHCGDCGRRWDGLEQAHCPTCHRHWGSVAAFDLHRQGPIDARFCADPETIVWGPASRYAGKPRLRGAEGPHGVTWVLTVQNSLFVVPAGRGDAALGIGDEP